MVPYPALIAAAVTYYLLLGLALCRALAHKDTMPVVLTVVVLALARSGAPRQI
jgi:hypothetical protein